jgi:hypothetical protein
MRHKSAGSMDAPMCPFAVQPPLGSAMRMRIAAGMRERFFLAIPETSKDNPGFTVDQGRL